MEVSVLRNSAPSCGPGADPPILGHVLLECCYVCNGTAGLHNHHIIPQAYGGVDGPQVTLCGAHHTMIHSDALSRVPKSYPQQHERRLTYLVSVIRAAKVAHARSNVSKVTKINLDLDTEAQRKLAVIRQHTGATSQHRAVLNAIELAYGQVAAIKI